MKSAINFNILFSIGDRESEHNKSIVKFKSCSHLDELADVVEFHKHAKACFPQVRLTANLDILKKSHPDNRSTSDAQPDSIDLLKEYLLKKNAVAEKAIGMGVLVLCIRLINH